MASRVLLEVERVLLDESVNGQLTDAGFTRRAVDAHHADFRFTLRAPFNSDAAVASEDEGALFRDGYSSDAFRFVHGDQLAVGIRSVRWAVGSG